MTKDLITGPRCAVCNGLEPFFRPGGPNELHLNVSISKLMISAQNCNFCALLFEGCKATQQEPNVSAETSEVTVEGYTGLPLKLHWKKSSVEFFVDEDSPSPCEFIPALPPRTLKSIATQTREWMRDCEINHGCVSEQDLPRLPRRVIDVGDEAEGCDPILVQYEHDNSPRARFVALSYCWGTSGNIKTTRANLQRHLRGIPWQSIPKTLQDAVFLTRALGIQYLWIDALCILQDDTGDFAQHSTAMGRIYSNAALVIGASSSPDVNSGMILNSADLVPPFRLPNKNNTKLAGTLVRIRRLWKHNTLPTPGALNIDVRFPLAQRAWAFQERYLAARSLHCFQDDVVWICKDSAHRCMCTVRHRTKDMSDATIETHKKSISPDELDWVILLRIWFSIIQEYSMMQLTHQTDRLHAIAGLATAWSEQMPHLPNYTYGMWAFGPERLLYQLAWHVVGPSDRTLGDWRPSWSWTSVTGRVTWSRQIMPETFGNGKWYYLFNGIGLDTSISVDEGPTMVLKGDMWEVQIINDPFTKHAQISLGRSRHDFVPDFSGWHNHVSLELQKCDTSSQQQVYNGACLVLMASWRMNDALYACCIVLVPQGPKSHVTLPQVTEGQHVRSRFEAFERIGFAPEVQTQTLKSKTPIGRQVTLV